MSGKHLHASNKKKRYKIASAKLRVLRMPFDELSEVILPVLPDSCLVRDMPGGKPIVDVDPDLVRNAGASAAKFSLAATLSTVSLAPGTLAFANEAIANAASSTTATEQMVDEIQAEVQDAADSVTEASDIQADSLVDEDEAAENTSATDAQPGSEAATETAEVQISCLTTLSNNSSADYTASGITYTALNNDDAIENEGIASEESLRTAIAAATAETPVAIDIAVDFDIANTVNIPENANVTINLNEHKLTGTGGEGSTVFSVGANATLTVSGSGTVSGSEAIIFASGGSNASLHLTNEASFDAAGGSVFQNVGGFQAVSVEDGCSFSDAAVSTGLVGNQCLTYSGDVNRYVVKDESKITSWFAKVIGVYCIDEADYIAYTESWGGDDIPEYPEEYFTVTFIVNDSVIKSKDVYKGHCIGCKTCDNSKNEQPPTDDQIASITPFGEHFVGWSVDGNTCISIKDTPIISNTTFMAIFEADSHTITLAGVDESGSGKTVTATVEDGKKLDTGTLDGGSQLTADYLKGLHPNKSGYEFVGWIVNDDDNNGEYYTDKALLELTISADTTITSVYVKTCMLTLSLDTKDNAYKAAFDTAIAGKIVFPIYLDVQENTLVKDVIYGDGTVETLLKNPPTIEGFEFIGWFDNDNEKVDDFESLTVDKDLSLTARYKYSSVTPTEPDPDPEPEPEPEPEEPVNPNDPDNPDEPDDPSDDSEPNPDVPQIEDDEPENPEPQPEPEPNPGSTLEPEEPTPEDPSVADPDPSPDLEPEPEEPVNPNDPDNPDEPDDPSDDPEPNPNVPQTEDDEPENPEPQPEPEPDPDPEPTPSEPGDQNTKEDLPKVPVEPQNPFSPNTTVTSTLPGSNSRSNREDLSDTTSDTSNDSNSGSTSSNDVDSEEVTQQSENKYRITRTSEDINNSNAKLSSTSLRSVPNNNTDEKGSFPAVVIPLAIASGAAAAAVAAACTARFRKKNAKAAKKLLR